MTVFFFVFCVFQRVFYLFSAHHPRYRVLVVEDDYIAEFKMLYKKRYGVELTDAEASLRANHLLNLYRAVLSPGSKGVANEKAGTEQPMPHDEN
jgi:hypothetical protein